MNEKDLERQKKLEVYQDRHGVLSANKRSLKKKLNSVCDELAEVNKELGQVGQAIFDLKHVDGLVPHITDHAIVRYLERVKGEDIWQLKAEILAHRNAVNIDNTIVTVNGDVEDNNDRKAAMSMSQLPGVPTHE